LPLFCGNAYLTPCPVTPDYPEILIGGKFYKFMLKNEQLISILRQKMGSKNLKILPRHINAKNHKTQSNLEDFLFTISGWNVPGLYPKQNHLQLGCQTY
jgi:hypothetical protein